MPRRNAIICVNGDNPAAVRWNAPLDARLPADLVANGRRLWVSRDDEAAQFDREAHSRNGAPTREIVHVAAQSCQHHSPRRLFRGCPLRIRGNSSPISW